MNDCGHLALIASGEARGLCPLCQRAEVERLRAQVAALSRTLNGITNRPDMADKVLAAALKDTKP